MKKTVFALLLVLLWTVSSAVAAELKVGDKASDFKLKDSTGKEYSLDHPQFKGKVLYIAYVDPDEKDTNNHVEDALKKERDSGGLDKTRYEGFGIVNLKATNLPNFLIKSAIKSKQEKTGAIILLDLRLHHPQPLGTQERLLRRGRPRQGADLPVCLQRQAAAGRARQDDPDHQGVSGEVAGLFFNSRFEWNFRRRRAVIPAASPASFFLNLPDGPAAGGNSGRSARRRGVTPCVPGRRRCGRKRVSPRGGKKG